MVVEVFRFFTYIKVEIHKWKYTKSTARTGTEASETDGGLTLTTVPRWFTATRTLTPGTTPGSGRDRRGVVWGRSELT